MITDAISRFDYFRAMPDCRRSRLRRHFFAAAAAFAFIEAAAAEGPPPS